MRSIAVAMQKGGVGKTTTAAHLAAGLAAHGKRVLLVDLDPQCQQAQIFGVTVDEERTIYEAMMRKRPTEECVHACTGFDLIPAERNWRAADVEIYPLMDGRDRLRKALLPLQDRYDYAVFDTPPNLGALTSNALVAATEVLVPVQTDQGAFNELPVFLETFQETKENLNSELSVLGLLPTMYDVRNGQDRQILGMLRDNPLELRCFGPIPRRARIKECFARQATVFAFDREASDSYEHLVKEIA